MCVCACRQRICLQVRARMYVRYVSNQSLWYDINGIPVYVDIKCARTRVDVHVQGGVFVYVTLLWIRGTCAALLSWQPRQVEGWCTQHTSTIMHLYQYKILIYFYCFLYYCEYSLVTWVWVSGEIVGDAHCKIVKKGNPRKNLVSWCARYHPV